ncbi:MAG: sulfurtransferase TusA family protein [Thermodesulfovibrionales bacterium]
MSNIVDARGLSCPQPVMITLAEISKINKGQLVILVDTDTSRENVTRAAKTLGWQVSDIQPEDVGYRITISKD